MTTLVKEKNPTQNTIDHVSFSNIAMIITKILIHVIMIGGVLINIRMAINVRMKNIQEKCTDKIRLSNIGPR